jgi:hypothetical protein
VDPALEDARPSSAEKADVYRLYGISYPQPTGRYELDHIVPVSWNGDPDNPKNEYPQPNDTPDPAMIARYHVSAAFVHNSKDLLEIVVHREICNHTVQLAQAQHDIMTDWRVAYVKYIGPPPTQTTASTGPFVTLLFSRTEEGTARNCVPNNGGVRLTDDLAPWLAGLGLVATGTVNTLATTDTVGCTHYGETTTSSWSDLQTLAGYGWMFTPHYYYSATKTASLTAAQKQQATCGQATTLKNHSLPGGNGMISYPGLQQNTTAIADLQKTYGASCFGWGRHYGKTPTPESAASTAPYWQSTLALKGGPGTGSKTYTDPASVISQISALQTGEWLTLQIYVLVRDVSPAGDTITWDCNAPEHRSSDVERYCDKDFRQIAQYLSEQQALGNLTVTDPATVAAAWGRSLTQRRLALAA